MEQELEMLLTIVVYLDDATSSPHGSNAGVVQVPTELKYY